MNITNETRGHMKDERNDPDAPGFLSYFAHLLIALVVFAFVALWGIGAVQIVVAGLSLWAGKP
jgi:hypothetical protein